MNVQTDIRHVVEVLAGNEPRDLAVGAFGMASNAPHRASEMRGSKFFNHALFTRRVAFSPSFEATSTTGS
jgi:hypothetical protein